VLINFFQPFCKYYIERSVHISKVNFLVWYGGLIVVFSNKFWHEPSEIISYNS